MLTVLNPLVSHYPLSFSNRNIRLSSKTVFDIPISFAPLEMREYEALCTVIMHKSNSGKCESSKSIKSSSSSSSVRWLIPIKVSYNECTQFL
ncbi:unnamed protein product [Schistosoma mattheei]|uniref:Uncharacterized protein n=1 Tax=Schistosoma mattheei TaxID=31246 RepID=A0A183PN35_9TREM|nr:unnamed protein product [Schistosoma mattheei]